jgi:hypothetical protein
MADQLPPDLARLGDSLTSAAERTITATRRRAERRRRHAATVAAGALAFVALTPATLGPAERRLDLALEPGFAAAGCDQPHGGKFTMTRCEAASPLNRPYAIR